MAGGGKEPRRARLYRAATLLGVARLGFFVPYRYARHVPPSGRVPANEAVEALFRRREPQFLDLLDGMASHADALLAIGGDPPPAPRWNQDWFPRLDAAAAYTLVRRRRPRHLVEVGSGHSTRFLMRAIADEGFAATVTTIDPAPRAALRELPLHHIAAVVPGVGMEPFRKLAAGDVLFIDSSHILMPGTDVDFLFGHVLPLLPAGVLIHIHDVFLPDDYPEAWAWRGYNEQSAVAALLAGGGFEPLFASHYVATRLADRLAGSVPARLPKPAGAWETSLWLCKTAPGLSEPPPDAMGSIRCDRDQLW